MRGERAVTIAVVLYAAALRYVSREQGCLEIASPTEVPWVASEPFGEIDVNGKRAVLFFFFFAFITGRWGRRLCKGRDKFEDIVVIKYRNWWNKLSGGS